MHPSSRKVKDSVCCLHGSNFYKKLSVDYLLAGRGIFFRPFNFDSWQIRSPSNSKYACIVSLLKVLIDVDMQTNSVAALLRYMSSQITPSLLNEMANVPF